MQNCLKKDLAILGKLNEFFLEILMMFMLAYLKEYCLLNKKMSNQSRKESDYGNVKNIET